jgi:hypothetical protein
MSGKIYLSSAGSVPTNLTQDLYINNVNVGAVSYQTPIFVNLQDAATTPVTPISVTKPANVATVTLPTPAAAGVALQFPIPSQGISYRTYDTGWRAQNGWYAYTPPTYPAKYAQLDTTQGANQWYKLKTALTVNGITSTERFVDLSGIQGWAALNNLNLAVLDKLTGLMITRTPAGSGGGSANWLAQFNTAASYSVVINGNTYSDWYLCGLNELQAIFGLYAPNTNWVDPISSVTIMNTNYQRVCLADSDPQNPTYVCQGYQATVATGGLYVQINTNVSGNQYFYIHDARNLIS